MVRGLHCYAEASECTNRNTATGSCSSDSDYCLCLSAPKCHETDGTTSNTAPCLCGDTGCTIASGLNCYASENYCFTGPPCTVTDGSIANTELCGCGNVGCTIATGLHCYASENDCSLLCERNVDFPNQQAGDGWTMFQT